MTLQRIAVFSGKGGVGKTTIAAALAQVSGSTLLDTDPQLTATDWGDRRSEPPAVISAQLGRVPQLLEQHPRAVIDTPGALVGNLSAALRAVDLTLLVTGDGQPELDALPASIDTAKAAGTPFVVVLNRLHPLASCGELMELIEHLGAPVCPVVIRERSAHRRAWEHGLTANEHDPDGAAARQIRSLWLWLSNRSEWLEANHA
jgi:chromosome partitioning protein